MRLLRRRGQDGGAAVAPPPAVREAVTFDGGDDELRAEIARLTDAVRANADGEAERRLVGLRHLAGRRLMDATSAAPEHPRPEGAALPESDTLPEFTRDAVTPGLLRAAILRDGCLLVRGLVDRGAATRFAAQIDRAFAERERSLAGADSAPGFYDEVVADGFDPGGRGWIKEGGGLLAADSPRLMFEMLEMFRAAGVQELVGGYLGEPPLMSLEKTTLRKADPSVSGAWHQDGKFMGPVRALNLWLSLSRCGDEAPGLDIVPRRLDSLVTAGDQGTFLGYQVSQENAEEAAGGKPILRPVFEPGDALFFDELFLHQTGSDPAMPNPRFAIESWFFGGSAFPADYVPLDPA